MGGKEMRQRGPQLSSLDGQTRWRVEPFLSIGNMENSQRHSVEGGTVMSSVLGILSFKCLRIIETSSSRCDRLFFYDFLLFQVYQFFKVPLTFPFTSSFELAFLWIHVGYSLPTTVAYLLFLFVICCRRSWGRSALGNKEPGLYAKCCFWRNIFHVPGGYFRYLIAE